VVTPVSSNSGVVLSGRFDTVVRTKIGSPFVIAGMQDHARVRVVGYEANGGFLLGFDARLAGPLPALMTRDCVLPILGTLVAARAAGGVAARVAQEPARFTASDRIENMATDRTAALLAELMADAGARAALLTTLGLPVDPVIDTTDGLRMTAGATVLHLRPSGNAPECRVYVEAADTTAAERLLDLAMVRVRELTAQGGAP
jgi:phosphomannomutase